MTVPAAVHSTALSPLSEALLSDLRGEWTWKSDTFAMHWDRCPARRRNDACLKCNEYEREANAAEDLYLGALRELTERVEQMQASTERTTLALAEMVREGRAARW